MDNGRNFHDIFSILSLDHIWSTKTDLKCKDVARDVKTPSIRWKILSLCLILFTFRHLFVQGFLCHHDNGAEKGNVNKIERIMANKTNINVQEEPYKLTLFRNGLEVRLSNFFAW